MIDLRVPETLNDCFAIVEQQVSPKSLNALRRAKEEELCSGRFRVQKFLRDRFLNPAISPIRDKLDGLPMLMGTRRLSNDDVLLLALWLHLHGQCTAEDLADNLNKRLVYEWERTQEALRQLCAEEHIEDDLMWLQKHKPQSALAQVQALFKQNP